MVEDLLTPERWGKARAVLSGETDEVSLSAAARAAGVTRAVLKGWIKRSSESRPEDEPWIYEISEVCGNADEIQADRLKDVAWKHAVEGTLEPVFQGGKEVGRKRKFDHKLLIKELEVRDDKYQPKHGPTVPNDLLDDPAEMRRRLMAILILGLGPPKKKLDPPSIEIEAVNVSRAK